MPVYYEWTSTKKSNRFKHDSPRFEVSSYPLKTNVLTLKESSSSSIIDHINKWSSGFEEVDPLLRFEQMNLEEEINPLEVEKTEGVNYSKAWSTRRAGILSKYTTGEKLTIVSSYLPGGEKELPAEFDDWVEQKSVSRRGMEGSLSAALLTDYANEV